MALRLEHRFTKREILAIYLNLASYGNQIAGVQRAAAVYFGIDAAMATPAQAAFLAALPQRPSRFQPLEGRRDGAGEAAERPHPDGGGGRAERRPARARRGRSGSRSSRIAPRSRRRISSRWCAPGRTRTRPASRPTLDLDLQREVDGIIEHQRGVAAAHGAANVAVVVLDNAHREWLAWEGIRRLWRCRPWRRDQWSA